MPKRPPKYSLHKPSGRARVRINGKDIYLGDYESRESRERYNQIVAKWLTGKCDIDREALTLRTVSRRDRSSENPRTLRSKHRRVACHTRIAHTLNSAERGPGIEIPVIRQSIHRVDEAGYDVLPQEKIGKCSVIFSWRSKRIPHVCEFRSSPTTPHVSRGDNGTHLYSSNSAPSIF
jgi:hypothetical protein